MGNGLKMLFNNMFGPAPKGKKKGPPPKHEYMGCEVNLLSANQNAEGKGSGGAPMNKGATDAWLGGMPGM